MANCAAQLHASMQTIFLQLQVVSVVPRIGWGWDCCKSFHVTSKSYEFIILQVLNG